MQSATCAVQAVEHHHVIRANRPQLSKQAGVCSDGPIDDVIRSDGPIDNVVVVGECVSRDSSKTEYDAGCRIPTDLSAPISGISLFANLLFCLVNMVVCSTVYIVDLLGRL